MSDLARAHARHKLAGLPLEAPAPVPEEVEDDQADDSSASSISSTGTIIPTSAKYAAPVHSVSWVDFYAQELYLEKKTEESSAKYHVFVTPPASARSPLFVLHHGAGSSGMSFALLTRELRAMLPDAGVLSIEAREHGSVVRNAAGEVNTDLSVDALSGDLVHMIELTAQKLNLLGPLRLVLVGHSLGGSVVTHAAKAGKLGAQVIGFAVLDVVEGSALELVKSMSTYFATRPVSFASPEQAVEWHLRTRALRNPASARASVPPLIREVEPGSWHWKLDVAGTEPFWENWFTGMSRRFLEARGAKLLLLAGTDRLDKELMIGQMQGKFQMAVFPAAGHFIHEDLPSHTAEALVEFFKRNDSSSIRLPPKVSELLAQGKKV